MSNSVSDTSDLLIDWLIICFSLLGYNNEEIRFILRIINVHFYLKVKGIFVPTPKNHAMKTYLGSGGTDPPILNLGTRWRWVFSFTHRPLCPRYPLDMRMGRPQNRSKNTLIY